MATDLEGAKLALISKSLAELSDGLEAVADALEREGYGPPRPELSLVEDEASEDENDA